MEYMVSMGRSFRLAKVAGCSSTDQLGSRRPQAPDQTHLFEGYTAPKGLPLVGWGPGLGYPSAFETHPRL